MKSYLLFVCFSFFILSISFFNIISQDKSFSEIENRYLQIKPVFSFDKFINGNFSEKYEQFINDQFIFRDKWINIKMMSEMLLLKTENNNIIIGKDNYLFDKLIILDEKKIDKNIDYIKSFIKKNKSKNIYFTLIPNSYEILKNKLPVGLNNIDQTKNINKVYKKLLSGEPDNLNIINSEKFLKNKQGQIYYYTDHHWTSFGAYLFYQGLSKPLNYKPVDLKSLEKHKIKNFYGTYYSRAKIFWKKPDTIVYYKAPIEKMEINNKFYNEIYDLKKFKERDKYSGFLYGNNGLTVIRCEKSDDKKEGICVIKDSYANSFIPFLTYNYNNIYVIDLRYIKRLDISNFIDKNKIDNILMMYNFINFVSDNNIQKIEYLN